jgi:hypothetical protein
MSREAFAARLAAAKADLDTSLRESGEGVTNSRITFPGTAPGPRILNVETQWLGWTFKGELAGTGKTPALSGVLILTNDCALGKVEGWQRIRLQQNLNLGPMASSLSGLESALEVARERLDSLEGAVLRCTATTRTEFPPVAGVTIPAQEVEMRTEIVSLKPTAISGLFEIPSDYKAVEFPMNPRRMLAYISLPPLGEPPR